MRKFVSFMALVALMAGYGCSKKDSTISFDLGMYSDPTDVPGVLVTQYDPTFESKIIIYYPPGYNGADTTVKYPIAYFLHGYGGDYTFYKDVYDLGTLMSYLIATDSIQPMILVFVNGRNLFFGSFYSNSDDRGNPVFGMHEDYFVSELMPYVENQLIGEKKLNGERYIAGYSMGGYGAFMLAAKHSDLFNKAASLSGPHAFVIFKDDDSARAGLFNFFDMELASDTLVFKIIRVKSVGGEPVDTTVLYTETVGRGGSLPLTIDTLFYIFSKPGTMVVDTVLHDTLIGDTVYTTRYQVIHTSGYYPKRFTMYMTALSAAFTPKVDACTNFNVVDNEYIVAIVDSGAGICAGIRLPVYKDLRRELVSNVIDEWVNNHDVQQLIQNNNSNILTSGIKWYMSSGTGMDNDLETVIYAMNGFLKDKFDEIYGNEVDNYVQVNFYEGQTDPFGEFRFPATHNQYIYEELGNVLRFFGK